MLGNNSRLIEVSPVLEEEEEEEEEEGGEGEGEGGRRRGG